MLTAFRKCEWNCIKYLPSQLSNRDQPSLAPTACQSCGGGIVSPGEFILSEYRTCRLHTFPSQGVVEFGRAFTFVRDVMTHYDHST
jgi:hypothetical protein